MKNTRLVYLKLFLLVLVCMIDVQVSSAQVGYRLNFKVDGWRDTTVYLGHYYGETVYIKDTAFVGRDGAFKFEGAKLKNHGVYFVAMIKDGKANRQFDFLINDDQQFTITTTTNDILQSMIVTGSDENLLFYKNIKHQTNLRHVRYPLKVFFKTQRHQRKRKKLLRRTMHKSATNCFCFKINS